MKKTLIFGVLALSPLTVLAQSSGIPGIGTALDAIADMIALATPLVAGLALLYFFYGLAKYILNAGDEEKKSEGRSIMIWGIIALFVMVSVWGITQMLQTTFGVQNIGAEAVPGIIPKNSGGGATF